MWVGVCSILWHHLVVNYAVFLGSQSYSAEVRHTINNCRHDYNHYHFSLVVLLSFWSITLLNFLILASARVTEFKHGVTSWLFQHYPANSCFALLSSTLSVKRGWSRAVLRVSGCWMPCSDVSAMSLVEILTSDREPGHDKLVSNLIQGLTVLRPP